MVVAVSMVLTGAMCIFIAIYVFCCIIGRGKTTQKKWLIAIMGIIVINWMIKSGVGETYIVELLLLLISGFVFVNFY